MAAPRHNIFDNNHHHYDLDRWDCPICFKTISSSRPPVYNADNCSCADLGNFTNGLNQAAQPASYSPQGHQYESNAAKYCQTAQSYASSAISVPCPEGPEREDPNLHITNTYLPLGPDIGLNEAQHQRSASIHANMSYQMRRFLVDQKESLPCYTAETPSETRFLPQDIYIQSRGSKKTTKKERKRSESGYPSFQGPSSEEQGFISIGVDPTAYVGDWADEGGIKYSADGYGYPLTMSGMTEFSGE